jgi:hypothetical protein
MEYEFIVSEEERERGKEMKYIEEGEKRVKTNGLVVE